MFETAARKSETFDDFPVNGIIPSEHDARFVKTSFGDCDSDVCRADFFIIYFELFNRLKGDIASLAEIRQQNRIACAVSAEMPISADRDTININMRR